MVARFRPQNKAELALGGESIVDFETEDTCNLNVSHMCDGIGKLRGKLGKDGSRSR